MGNPLQTALIRPFEVIFSAVSVWDILTMTNAKEGASQETSVPVKAYLNISLTPKLVQ